MEFILGGVYTVLVLVVGVAIGRSTIEKSEDI